MKYGTLIDGAPVMAPNPLHVGNYFIYNPHAEHYLNDGYLPIIETPYPEISEDADYMRYKETWIEENNQIIRLWELMELTEEVIEENHNHVADDVVQPIEANETIEEDV